MKQAVTVNRCVCVCVCVCVEMKPFLHSFLLQSQRFTNESLVPPAVRTSAPQPETHDTAEVCYTSLILVILTFPPFLYKCSYGYRNHSNMLIYRSGKCRHMSLTSGARRSGWWRRSGRRCWYRKWVFVHPLDWWPGRAAWARCWWGWSSDESQDYLHARGRTAAKHTQTSTSAVQNHYNNTKHDIIIHHAL